MRDYSEPRAYQLYELELAKTNPAFDTRSEPVLFLTEKAIP